MRPAPRGLGLADGTAAGGPVLLQLAFPGAGSGLNISDPPGAASLDYDLSQPGALPPLMLGQARLEVLPARLRPESAGPSPPLMLGQARLRFFAWPV